MLKRLLFSEHTYLVRHYATLSDHNLGPVTNLKPTDACSVDTHTTLLYLISTTANKGRWIMVVVVVMNMMIMIMITWMQAMTFVLDDRSGYS